MRRAIVVFLWISSTIVAVAQTEKVNPIAAPKSPLPPEAQSAAVTKSSFIVYGDTRGRRDGTAVQYDHSMLVDSMLDKIKNQLNSDYPIKFVLQSGDAVLDGRAVRQWNVSFVPIINRLTLEGGVPYFLVPGNHEHTETAEGMRNYLDAVSALIPPEGSPRRASGLTTYSFAMETRSSLHSMLTSQETRSSTAGSRANLRVLTGNVT